MDEREINCDCGELLGVKNLITKVVKLKDNIPYTIEDKDLNVPSIVCKCPECKEINYIRGIIK